LSSIATRRLDEKGAIYDPQDALWFIERSMKSAREEIGFRTGENIYSSMGRIDMIAASKVRALAALGRYAEAKEFGMNALRNASQQYGRERIAKVLQQVATKAGDSTLLQEIASLEKPVIKDFTFTTLDGTKGSIKEHRGKVVVMDFWFAGCAGCAAEHKALNDLAVRYANRTDVLFLSVSLNDATTLRHYLSKKPLAFQTIPDGQAICDLNGVTAFPTHVILDKDGNTVLWETGGSTLAVENLEISMITTLGK
jgi:peroxiredoxin